MTGLDSVVHKIISINNSNGVGINSVQISNSGLVTCFLETPINGFDNNHLQLEMKFMLKVYKELVKLVLVLHKVEYQHLQRIEGTGYNSDNYNYSFFDVTDYTAGTQCIAVFSTAGVTTNPGIAKTFQSGYATLINKKKYPVIEPVQSRGVI